MHMFSKSRSIFRTLPYCVFAIFSLVLFGLAAARLHHTTHLPPGDPLNHGANFFDHIIVEIIVSTILGMAWSAYAVVSIPQLNRDRSVETCFSEIVVLSGLFVLYLVGAAIASHLWGDLSFCHHFQVCRLLTALVAFAWMSWIVLLCLLVTTPGTEVSQCRAEYD